MKSKSEIESILVDRGFTEFAWIKPKEIVVANWVRVKCTFGCDGYGAGTCPPNTPSVSECERFFNEYETGLIIRLTKYADKNAYPTEWSGEMTNKLCAIEREIFLSGSHKAFLLNQSCCTVCKDCSGNRINCKDKIKSRPSPEGFAVDVYQTVRNAGFKINVVADSPSEMNKIAILLIE